MAASRGDCHTNGVAVLKRVVNYIRDMFKGKIWLVQDCFVLDCRRSSSPEMRQLKTCLGEVKQQLQQTAPLYPRLYQPVVSKLLPALRKKQKDPFMETATLMERIEQEACPGQENKIVEKVVGFLNDSGEIAVVADVAALNPSCLHEYAIGPIIASEDFKWHIRSKRKDGTVTREEAEMAVSNFLKDKKIAVQLNTDKVLALNNSLNLCFKVEGEDNMYMYPALLPPKDLSVMWVRDESKQVYVGRRQVCSSLTTIFSPSTFSMFQSKVCTTLQRNARLWRDGLIISQCDTVHNYIECLVAMIDPVRSVDFVCRGGKATEVECVSLLDTSMSLWRDMLDRYSPGTEYETKYLSRKHLEEHKELKQVAVYSEEQIKKAKAKNKGADTAVTQIVGDKEMVETLSDLLVLPILAVHSSVAVKAATRMNVPKEMQLDEARHFSERFQSSNLHDFKTVRDAVVKHGCDQWYEIGLELGLKGDNIKGETHEITFPAGKLQAVIEAKIREVGKVETAKLLLRACRQIPTPIHKGVEGELGKS